MISTPRILTILVVTVVSILVAADGLADDQSQAVQSAEGAILTPQAVDGPAAMPSPGQMPSGAPPGSSQGGPGNAKPIEKPGDSAKSDGPKENTIRRGSVVTETGDRSELKNAALGEDGRVAFEFRNQGWPELIEWLSDLSQQPFDWLELPADRVNITTPSRYTATEVIDLFNRHLLSRGYTMLALEGGMTVVKCSAINPAVVPRVSPEQLGSVPPHSFVRTSLDVGWLSAEKLAQELKAMISENGKLTALTTTNRIEAMDAAITLKQIAELLEREQDVESRESLAPEFKLRHIPADEAKRLLEQFLGVSNKPEPPMSPEQMQQMQMQMQMQMQQGGKPPAPEKPKVDISIVANTRQNSIFIKAPPDRVAIATEFLKRIDVPGATLSSLADVRSRVEVFRLASLDPEKLIEIVREMNVLEPSTNIRVDSENRALIVSGSTADRFIIQQILTRLDGSGRKFEVLQLRRLEANDVAESIAFLMGMDEKNEGSSRQRYPFFFGGGDEKKKKEDKFRVAANTRFRQVLLWANDSEMSEVRNLLVKLGELPPPSGNERNIRVINADINPETFRYLKGLERQWQQIAPNPLLLPDQDRFEDKRDADDLERKPAFDSDPTKDNDGKEEDGSPAETETKQIDTATVSTQNNLKQLTATFAEDTGDSARPQPFDRQSGDANQPQKMKIESVDDFDREFMPATQNRTVGDRDATAIQPVAPEPNRNAPHEPIRVEIDSSGNLVISSRDTAALDRLEDVILQFAPPRRTYHTFTTKYTSAIWVKLNLEDFFKDEDDKKENPDNFSRWFFGFDSDDDDKKGPSGLGRSAKLKFLADLDTGTIVVSNASAEQLKTIEELIQLWDVPEPVNNRRVRYTRLVPIRYGRAGKIAETIKETYRDLLSSNDKAFQQPGQPAMGGGNQVQKANSANARPAGSELVDMGGSGQQGGGSDFSFKGKLSLGIDELGNTLLVSAEGEQLLKLVCDMIDQLDQAARSADGVRVVNMPASVNAAALEMALRTLRSGTDQPSGTPATAGQPVPSVSIPQSAKRSPDGGPQSQTAVGTPDG